MSDLPVETCGCASCRPDLAEQPWEPGHDGAFIPVQYVGTWVEAQYAGTCQCGCGQRYPEGSEIVYADLAAERGDAVAAGWCLLDHTRPSVALFGGGH